MFGLISMRILLSFFQFITKIYCFDLKSHYFVEKLFDDVVKKVEFSLGTCTCNEQTLKYKLKCEFESLIV